MNERVPRRITDFTYRFRPEQPIAEVAHIALAGDAQRTFVAHNTPLSIAVWNTFKGKRERYYDLLAAYAPNADLILLQEFRHDPKLAASHQVLFTDRDARMAISFYTQPNQTSPTGVCTVSKIQSAKSLVFLSRYLEPVTRTPKAALCTYYPIDSPECPLEQALLVINSHGINFRLRRPFLDQMLQLEAHLRHHLGPIILVGDFNTWEKGRVRIMEAIGRRIGLTHIQFPRGIKSVGRHELDRVYVRGGEVSAQRVIVDAAASDHSLLAFQWVLR